MNTEIPEHIARLDAEDPLAAFHREFNLREGLIYLDGNSLGPVPAVTPGRLQQAVSGEWGEGLITSWLGADWVNAPRRIGDKIAGFIGAADGEVLACDSTSINIFKALCAALQINSDRKVVLSETGNFPTDVYMMQGLEQFPGAGAAVEAKLVEPEQVLEHLDETVAVLLLTQVHYKTGHIRDMQAVTQKAHEAGVLVVWDLSHSAGSIVVDLNGARADFAVGCGYKFLNGGPGAPAFLFVAGRHQEQVNPVLSGWFGHRAPFDFDDTYKPAGGVNRFQCGTPPVLGLTALECGVDILCRCDMQALRAKSMQLGALFIETMQPLCDTWSFELVSPREDSLRGGHVSYRHEQGYAVMQALKAQDVIGDFRAPDVLRFGMTPLSLRYRDIHEAVRILEDIMRNRRWDIPEYRTRAAVT